MDENTVGKAWKCVVRERMACVISNYYLLV